MEQFSIALAGKTVAVTAIYPSTKEFCHAYLAQTPADFAVEIAQKDIAYERDKSALEDEFSGARVRHFSDPYLETLAVYRKIAEKMPDYQTLLFHGSAVAVDGTGYLFTAKSGTGKSTHTRLWRNLFGDRAVMVNDDKPLLQLTAEGVTVCGTPWDGKHRLSSPICVPLKAICILERAETNHIRPISQSEAWPMLLQQAYRPVSPDQLAKTLALVDRLGKHVHLYRLGCNMQSTAAQVAYNGMKGT